MSNDVKLLFDPKSVLRSYVKIGTCVRDKAGVERGVQLHLEREKQLIFRTTAYVYLLL